MKISFQVCLWKILPGLGLVGLRKSYEGLECIFQLLIQNSDALPWGAQVLKAPGKAETSSLLHSKSQDLLFFHKFAIYYFTYAVLHSADKFSNEQQILRLTPLFSLSLTPYFFFTFQRPDKKGCLKRETIVWNIQNSLSRMTVLKIYQNEHLATLKQ